MRAPVPVRVLCVSLVLLAGLISTPSAAMACPACQTVLTPTWSERFAQSDVALLTRWKSARKSGTNTENDAGKKKPATSTFEVLQIARDADERFKTGQTLTLSKFIDGEVGELFLLTGQQAKSDNNNRQPKSSTDDEQSRIDWDDPAAISEAAYFYITQAPSPEEPGPKRLKYFLKFFEFPDPLVADDAYNEFAKAPFKDVKAAADAFPRKKLRRWLQDPETQQTRIGLYGLMLGLCGTEDDLPVLQTLITDRDREFRMGIEGVIAGYLLLKGEQGMDLIDRTKLKDSDTPFGETYMAIQGLRIIDSYGGGIVGNDRLKRSFRLMLDRPEAAELILPDLARWKDWELIDRVAKLYGQKDYRSAGFKRAAIRFLLAAGRDVPQNAEQPPPHAVKAKAHLEAIRQRDPKLYKQAVRTLF